MFKNLSTWCLDDPIFWSKIEAPSSTYYFSLVPLRVYVILFSQKRFETLKLRAQFSERLWYIVVGSRKFALTHAAFYFWNSTNIIISQKSSISVNLWFYQSRKWLEFLNQYYYLDSLSESGIAQIDSLSIGLNG